MNSLRTDDILGAKPRVRHMPKDLIRERRVPNAYFPNIPLANPEASHPGHYMQYPSRQRYGEVEYQNNDPTGIPFMPLKKLNKQPKHINYDQFRQPSDYSKRYQASRFEDPQLMRAASEQRNYAEDKAQSRGSNDGKKSQRNRHQQLNRNMESHLDLNAKEDRAQRRSEVKSRRSVQSRDVQQQRGKQMFRGLGFNIITNHKCQYLFEHNKPAAY